jgi:GT2 family glycosyltransferase
LFYYHVDYIAKADKRWIRNILAFIFRHPEIIAFGGPYKGYSLVEIPKWFKERYGTWTLGDKERPIEQNEWINGTNMIFKRSLLEVFGGFHTKIGMSGKTISFGEETNLLLKIKEKYYPIYYVPDIIVEHLIPEYKLSLKWMLKAN